MSAALVLGFHRCDPSRSLGLAGHGCGGAPYVLATSDGFKVARPDAERNEAQVIQCESIRYLSDAINVGEAVGEDYSGVRDAKAAVALGFAASPQPALAKRRRTRRYWPFLVDSRPESLARGRGGTAYEWVTPFSPSLVVHEAQTLAVCSPAAFIYSADIDSSVMHDRRITPPVHSQPVHFAEASTVNRAFTILHRAVASALFAAFSPALSHSFRNAGILHMNESRTFSTVTEA